MRYLFSEPVFTHTEAPDRFYAPAGRQAELCGAILRRQPLFILATQAMREEWWAILRAARRMSLDIGVAVATPVVDQAMAIRAKTELGCSLAGLRGIPPGSSATFPRDICALIGGHLLVNPEDIRLTASASNMSESPLAESGRMLYDDKVALIAERIHHSKPNERVNKRHLWIFGKVGMRYALLPLFHSVNANPQEIKADHGGSNDHMDRVGGLLRARDGSRHLMVDATTTFLEFPGGGDHRPLRDPLSHIKRVCERVEVTVRPAPHLRVPYSLNFVQTDDGRVLMTGGEPELQGEIGELVGPENVFTTEIPIELHPSWRGGSIRCMIGDAPNGILKPIG